MKYIYDTWNSVMNHNSNPLKNIPDTNTRHMIIQVLAWMWCIAFSSYFTSMWSSLARAIYFDGKRYELDPKDVGGEHE